MLLGEYVGPAGGSAWTEVLVEALALVGVQEKAARQAIARLAAEGMLVSHRHGRRARWELTDRGRRWLGEGRSRSTRFHWPADAAIGKWLVLIVSLTEEQRDLRYQLNRRLVSLGWGPAGHSMWLNSGAVPEDVVATMLHGLGLDDRATMMRAEFLPPTRLAELVERAWDIPGLGARYRQFLADHSGPEPVSDAEAFERRGSRVRPVRGQLLDRPAIAPGVPARAVAW